MRKVAGGDGRDATDRIPAAPAGRLALNSLEGDPLGNAVQVVHPIGLQDSFRPGCLDEGQAAVDGLDADGVELEFLTCRAGPSGQGW